MVDIETLTHATVSAIDDERKGPFDLGLLSEAVRTSRKAGIAAHAVIKSSGTKTEDGTEKDR
jgi:hypothetical protein